MLKHLTSRLSPSARTGLSYAAWAFAALVLSLTITAFVARSYSVHGISMEPTLRGGDIVLTNKIPYSLAALMHTSHNPSRNALVVFKNPFYNHGDPDMFIVKRVIGLPGDRVIVRDGRITIQPGGDAAKAFNPDEDIAGAQQPTSGNVDRLIPADEIFVAGDNRLDKNSLDSRNGMSTVPLRDIQGTVVLRLWPLQNIRLF